MPLFVKPEKFFNPDEEALNSFVNKSFLNLTFCKVSDFLKVAIKKYLSVDKICDNLDNIYFFILAILIFAIPFVSTGVLGFLAFCLILISFINAIISHKKFEFSSIHLPMIIYLAILFLSTAFSALFIPSLKGLAKMLIYIGAFFSFFEFLKKNPRRIIITIGLIALSASLELLFSLKQMIFGVDELAGWQDKTGINPENLMNRVFGTLKPFNPNLFAGYLLAVVPAIFSEGLVTYLNKHKKFSVTMVIFSLLGIITIVQTGCRGAYIGLFAGFMLSVLLLRDIFVELFYKIKIPKKLLISIICGVVIAGVVFIIFSPSISHRLTSIFTFRGDSSNSYRMNVYASSARMFLDNFWIGIGPGNTTYRLIYGLYMVTGFDALGAYNIYLEMGVESGIFAIVSFLWLVVLVFSKAIKALKRLDIIFKIICVMCLCAVFSMLIHGIVDTVWYRPQLQLMFWLYMAILAVITMKGFAYEQ